jgi:hypothetical protein
MRQKNITGPPTPELQTSPNRYRITQIQPNSQASNTVEGAVARNNTADLTTGRLVVLVQTAAIRQKLWLSVHATNGSVR